MLLLLALACGDDPTDDDDDPPPDSGSIDVGFPDAGFAYEIVPAAPIAPAPPNEPVHTPCPSGWRTIARPGAPSVCDPWPASGRADCPPGQAHFPGAPGCEAIGSACPAGEFTDMGPTALYVTASTTAIGGDGSMQFPLTSIVQAINSAAPGGVIVLGRGTFDQTFLVDRDVMVMGSCAAETRVVSSFAQIDTGVATIQSDAELMNLTIGGASIGILVESG